MHLVSLVYIGKIIIYVTVWESTIFIERSENVNIEMCVQYILYRVSKIFYKFFVKKEKMYKKKIMVTCIYSTKFLKKSFCNL